MHTYFHDTINYYGLFNTFLHAYLPVTFCSIAHTIGCRFLNNNVNLVGCRRNVCIDSNEWQLESEQIQLTNNNFFTGFVSVDG